MSGRVHHRGIAEGSKKARKRKKRPCRSAPAVPANVSLRFRKRNEKTRPVWRAVARFDPVALDVAGRAIEPEQYEAQLQAVDASGDPVETHGQEVSSWVNGADFTVLGGSAPVQGKARELNASGDAIGTAITGLTTGIDAAVDFYIRKDVGGSSPTVQIQIYDTTSNNIVVQKNVTPDSIKPKLVGTRTVTPVAGHNYQARVQWQSGSGVALIQQVQWHDKGDNALWRERIQGDEDPPLRASFPDIPKPKVWYYQARVRCMNRVAGARCWSAWSAWTEALNPVTGDPIGPPAPDGLSLTFHRDEARKRSPFQAKALWNELPWWIPPDGEPVEGADRYAVRLAISEDGGTSTVRTRRVSLQAKDDDADQTAFYEFNNIRRRRYYRVSVRAFKDDRRGAWSDWSAWKSPKADIGNGPNSPLNVSKTRVKPGVLLFHWDEPNNPEDVDFYRVRVYNQGNLRETRKTRSQHYKYIIPDADRGTSHNAKVTAIDEDGNESTELDTGSESDTLDPTVGDVYEVGDIRKVAGTSIANWLSNHPKWLRCNGNGYSTSSYPQLFAEIGYTYGGSGSTFNVPDMNGRHPIGTSSVISIGADEGLVEASRNASHLHAQDETETFPDGNAQFADVGTGDQQNTPGADFTQEAVDHNHPAAFNGATININQSGIQYAANNSPTTGAQPRGDHGHPQSAFAGQVGSRSATHDHQGHGHGNHGHGHGHNNGNHHHSHGHGKHKHQHGHNNQTRPHKGVHFVIKALP